MRTKKKKAKRKKEQRTERTEKEKEQKEIIGREVKRRMGIGTLALPKPHFYKMHCKNKNHSFLGCRRI
jgi:hypothetical protein